MRSNPLVASTPRGTKWGTRARDQLVPLKALARNFVGNSDMRPVAFIDALQLVQLSGTYVDRLILKAACRPAAICAARQRSIQDIRGVSDPPHSRDGRPTAPPRGSLTPRLSVSQSDLAAALIKRDYGARVPASCKVSPRSGVQVIRRRPRSAHRRLSLGRPQRPPRSRASARAFPQQAPQRRDRTRRTITCSMVGSLSSPSRLSASLRPRLWRGFGLDGILDRAGSLRLRDGPGDYGPRMSAVASALDGAYGRHHRTRIRFRTDHPRSMPGTIS